ncbi:PREDICTED: zinc finger protein ZAT4-like [Nicotiana attenuata]|uniref:Zinc finger protein zat2 n=1 Tax=Nicotiana attenuata TaxID=49451 RepID=A0A1J6HWZ9_NICAT|nr:PREDICTED: zinc finger protein ZAT4-like [Nicotiana attenuata]OIS96905.1 zinc finger protein zat2 [Nicotiana attenuata]
MACIDQEQQQQQPVFKHYCRVCKKGFVCGRALGGHMRAHGIGDEGANLDDDDPASDWEDKFGGSVKGGNKRMYQLRTNPNRQKSNRVCENCGREFSSWKSFLEHGKCSSEESLVSSPCSEGEEYIINGERKGYGWSKRKRSLRTKVGTLSTSTYPSSEEDDLLLAKCLIDLANARVDTSLAEPEESCASASKEEERARNPMTYLAPLVTTRIPLDNKAKGASSKGLFECKACKKVFNSHQALGGHRASHKKVKGCYAAKQDQLDDSLIDDQDMNITHDEFTLQASKSMRKSKIHECSICHRVFSTGQALGGHKRCHWITSNSPDSSKYNFHSHMEQINLRSNLRKSGDALDLNIPSHEDMSRVRRDPMNPLSFEVSTEIHLHPWNTKDNSSDNYYLEEIKNNNDNNNNNNNSSTQNVEEDEADSKLKLAKLSELKDMNTSSENPSHWLQVGIGPTTEVGADS